MKIKNYIIAFLLQLLPFAAIAGGGDDVFTFLRLPHSAHVAALGGSNVSIISDDISLTMHNPALLSNVSDNTLGLGFMTYMSDGKIAGAAFGKHFGERSTGAITARYFDYGSFDGYTEDNIATGSFSAKDMEFAVSYSYLLSERWSGGVSGKFMYAKYDSYSAIALGVDLGVNYFHEESDFSASLALRNIGGQVKAFEDKNHTIPFDIQLGFTKRLAHAPIRLSVTLTDLHRWSGKHFYNPDGDDDSFGQLLLKHAIFGADVLIGKNFHASIGYNYRISRELSAEGSSWDGITAGFGITLKKFKLEASYSKLHLSSSSLLFNASYTL